MDIQFKNPTLLLRRNPDFNGFITNAKSLDFIVKALTVFSFIFTNNSSVKS